MRHLVPLLTLFTATLFLTACGPSDPHEAAVVDAIDIMSDLESTLAEVTDVESVQNMGPKFASIGERLNQLIKDMQDLEKPSKETEKSLEQKYKPQMEELQEKIETQIERIKGEGGIDVMLALMKEYNDLETDKVASDFYTNDFLP